MGLNKVKIGSFVELYSEACGIPNLTVNDVSGVNRDKEFFEPSKQVGADTSKYKVVPPNYFACNLMHVGRDVVLPIALNHSGKSKIVSPAYTVFRITDETIILKEYFFILLKSEERDRYFWFHTDSSIRDGMEWNVFCDVEIEIPDVSIQKKYVDIYQGLQKNFESLTRGQNDLTLVCNMLMAEQKKQHESVQIGELIDIVDERNPQGLDYPFYGINKDKSFMETVASTNNLDKKKYKIVRKNRFVFSGMQTGRDRCIRIGVFTENNPILVSPAYTTFEVKDMNRVIPEYLFLYFINPEADRYGWFISDGSVRSNLDWERFVEIQIPIPPIDIQQDIVNIYRAYNERIQLANRITELQRSICPILVRSSIAEGGQ